MSHPLVLQHAKRPATAVSAGWLASADPQEWLRELAHCRAQGSRVALYPVASSTANPRPAGVFLVPQGSVPRFRPRVQLLAELLPGVHAPRDAELSAGLGSHETGFFFPYQVHLFHPTLGLIGFDAKDELPAAKLLEIPPERGARWNRAIPAGKFSPQLKGFLIDQPDSPDRMLADAAQGIGDQATDLTKKDHASWNQAKLLGTGLAGGALLGAGWILGGMMKLSDFLSGPGVIGRPGGGKGNGKRPGKSRLQEWAEKNWQQLFDKRSREIERLMKLMEKDPDQGLRYALPLSGLPSRGVAPPTWKLGTRNLNFTHGHGAGATDGWDIGDDSRLKLEQKYRDAAKRETLLGRHERAAYIYGNLLGDWAAAAKSLIDAGRHRDAVSIYLHKMNAPAAAAKCMEDAGLLVQAAALYAECRDFEKAGDIHAKLTNETAAREMWLMAVDAQAAPMEKARILRDKIKDRPAALKILNHTWRSGSHVTESLKACFAMHRQDQDLPAAQELLEEFLKRDPANPTLPQKLKLIHAESIHWADGRFTRTFEDYAYRRMAEELAARPRSSADLLDFLPKLDPNDRLLARDARRFGLATSPPKIPATGAPKGILTPEQVILISKDIDWHSLSALPKGISLAGYGKEVLSVGQLRDNACHTSALSTTDDPGKSFVNHVVITSTRGSSRLFHFRDSARLHYRALDRVRTAGDDAIGTLRSVMAITRYGVDGHFAVLQYTVTGSLTVHIYSEAAVLRESIAVDLAPPEVSDMPWLMAGRAGDLCFTSGNFFAWRHPSGEFSLTGFSEPAQGMELSPIPSARQVLFTNSSEVLLLDIPAIPRKPIEPIALASGPEGGMPKACYLPDGSVVVVWQGQGQIYSPANRREPCARLKFPADLGTPVAVCPRGNGGFAILTADSQLVVFAR